MANEHEAWQEQAGLYVLGAMAASERAAFEAHLASCASCAEDVRLFAPIPGALAHVVPQTEPPADLRARVLASIGQNDARRKPDDGTMRLKPGADTVRLKPDTTYANNANKTAWLAAAASLVLAVALAAYAAQLRGRIGNLESRLREAMLRVDASERQIADARRSAGEAESKVAVLAAPDLTRVDLAGRPVAPQASARAYWSRSRGLVFTASNLPPLPPGRTYQLWVLAAQTKPIGAGLLKPDANGRVDAVFETPVDLPRPIAMAVTIEPEGGVPAPTGEMYLVGQATAP